MSESPREPVASEPPAARPSSDDSPKSTLKSLWRWRRLIFTIVSVFVGSAWLSLKFIILPSVASTAVAAYAESQGIELAVGDWSADLLDLTVTAHDVTAFSRGAYAQPEVFTVHALDLDLSLWSGLFGERWLQEIRVREPKIYLERLLSGRWNWEDLAAVQLAPSVQATLPPSGSAPSAPGQPGVRAASHGAGDAAPPRAEGDGSFVVPRIRVDGMGLQWVENLPAESEGGILQELKASLFLDDVALTATDLHGLVDLRPQPSRLNLEARTGDGTISFDGRVNLFYWAQPPAPAEGNAFAALQGPLWSPTLEAKLYLENVGAGAFARLTPDASIVPARGTMTGTVDLRMASHQVECVANVALRDVTFAVNESSPLLGRRRQSVEAQLADYRVTGQYQFPCGGLLAEEYRPFQAFQANVVRQALSDAPRQVQALAAIEHARYSEEPIEPELQAEASRIAGGVAPEVLQWMDLAEEIHRVAPVGRRGVPIPTSSRMSFPGGRSMPGRNPLGGLPNLGGRLRPPGPP